MQMSNNIKEILRKSGLFKHLSEQELDDLASQGISKTFPANELIVREGEIGDKLYVILSGTARVFTYNVKNEQIELTRLQIGDYFGEQALLTDQPLRRNANVAALTALTVITFSHEVLQSALKINKALHQLLEEHGQRQLITKLSKQLLDRTNKAKELFALFEGIETYAPQSIIFKQGEVPDNAYLLLNGTVEITLLDDNQNKLSSLIVPGQIFGEQAILKKRNRAGTATAKTPVKAMIINGTALQNSYQENPQINVLLSNIMQAYELPSVGMMTRHRGTFLGQTAVQTNILTPQNETIVLSHVSHANIFAMSYAKANQETINYHYEKTPEMTRDIQLVDNKLVGVISIGEWKDLVEIYRLLESKNEITKDMLGAFKKTGTLVGDVDISQQKRQEIETAIYSR